MFKGLEAIISLIGTVIDLVINLVKSIFVFTNMLIQGIPNAVLAVTLMPPFMIAGMMATIGVCTAMVLIGRKSS